MHAAGAGVVGDAGEGGEGGLCCFVGASLGDCDGDFGGHFASSFVPLSFCRGWIFLAGAALFDGGVVRGRFYMRM